MDAVDLRIVRLLTWSPHRPDDARRGLMNAWDVAAELGLHGTTVKRRLQAMQDAGILRGVFLIPAPTLLGQQGVLQRLTFADARAKSDAVSALGAHALTVGGRGAQAILSFVGNDVWIRVVAPVGADLDSYVEAIAMDVGAVASTRIEPQTWGPDPASITPLDRAILSALVHDALLTAPQVASTLDVTPKTVRARLSRLTRLGAFAVMPELEPSRLRGSLAVTLVAHPEPTKERDVAIALLNAFPEAIDSSAIHADTPFVTVAVPRLDDVDTALERAQSLRGVRQVEPLFLQALLCNAPYHRGAHPIAHLVRDPLPDLPSSRELHLTDSAGASARHVPPGSAQ